MNVWDRIMKWVEAGKGASRGFTINDGTIHGAVTYSVSLVDDNGVIVVGASSISHNEAAEVAIAQAERQANNDTVAPPPPPPPCNVCDGQGETWCGDPSYPYIACKSCMGTGAAPCDGCGEPSVAEDDCVPKCRECIELCWECGAGMRS